MRSALSVLLVIAIGWQPARAQPAAPPRYDDLPKLAANWPPAWAALVRDVVPARDGFEHVVMDRVAKQLKAEEATNETYRLADIVLCATLRHHLSLRPTAPLADDPTKPMEAELQKSLTSLRIDWLKHLQTAGDHAGALRLADQWLPTTARGHPLRGAILQLWVQQAEAALQKTDYTSARNWLDRIEAVFTTAKQADPVRKRLHERAEMLLKESATMPDAQAIPALQEALALWPRLAEARDTLERRKQSYRTLRVAVRSLPEQLSPATAWTEIEKQALALLFDRLYDVEHPATLGKRYRPQLAAAVPADASLTASIPLRRDAYWASGERVTAADLRHTALLMNQLDVPARSALWREILEMPRLEGNPLQIHIGYRQGLFDPLAPLHFWVLPQYYQGKQLDRSDDPDFARAPIGSGPFRYVGRKQDAGKSVAVFQANAYDLRRELGSLREIRFGAWTDPRSDLAKPLPHLALDVPTDQVPAFKDLGYTEVAVSGPPCVFFLAVNQRRPSLASASVRRVIAHAIDRQALLEKHFRSSAMKGKYHATANGLFPRGSWASCPAPRVPAELFQPEQARSLARKLAPAADGFAWTLKYANDDVRVKDACEAMAASITAVFQDAKIKANVRPVGLTPHELKKALQERDYDLLYTSEENLDDPVRLNLLFDSAPDAVKAGGSNYLGDDSDTKLQQLLHVCLQHRQFTALQENMQAVHVHLYETMPAIPLWQLDMHVMAHSSLSLPPLESRAVFARIQEWKITP
jgi:peptide/nickel transport system substrate-binding protein